MISWKLEHWYILFASTSMLAFPTVNGYAVDGQSTGGVLPPISQRFSPSQSEGQTSEVPNFQRHVVPLFGRLGCNGRSCHGSFQGRGGFRLSMFGYDFSSDHQALFGHKSESGESDSEESTRVNLSNPAGSLILTKPTEAEAHEGGKRFEVDGWEYRVLSGWINSGGKNDADRAGQLIRIDVTPKEILFRQPRQFEQLRVIAVWNNGTREDVTCLSRFDSLDDEIASVDASGMVVAKGKGDTHLVVTYDSAVETIPVMMPVSDRIDDRYPKLITPTRIDEMVADKLRKLGIVPSDRCTDEEFVRRVSLDVAGTMPSSEEVQRFVDDPSENKRLNKIDELLETNAYGLWWSTKFCDIMGLNGPLQLGNTEFGPIITEQWRSWLERKIRDNMPYDKIVEGMVVVISRPPGQSYDDYAQQMSAYTLSKDPEDFTKRTTMPHFWFRGNLITSEEKALAFAYTFMGVRLDCAQCHKHPFDRWSQNDFKQFAAIFERVKSGISPECKDRHEQLRKELGVPEVLDTAAKRRQAYWRWAAEGKVVPWPEVFIAPNLTDARDAADKALPKLLGGSIVDVNQVNDPRRPLMDWLLEKDNPYFAKAIVNRLWAHYFGRGIVEPADDLNLGNPPSNPQLFDDLARRFVESGYDLKWLHREIVSSLAYQRSWKPNDTNRHDERNFSRVLIRRLPAEVAVDAIYLATANSMTVKNFANSASNRRIGVQATADLSRTEYSLAVFGKPLRTINCDCEREQNPSLAQAIFIRNDQDLHAMLDRKDGWLAELSQANPASDPDQFAEWIRTAYLRTLSRRPSDQELTRSQEHIKIADKPIEGLRDVLWALLNTQEFITNH